MGPPRNKPPGPARRKKESARSLRQRAEEKLRASASAEKTALSVADSQRLLHDLRVHQLELEMQNEELRRIEQELEAARARYFDLYDLAPVGYLTLSEHSAIQEANLTVAKLLHTTVVALAKKPLTRFILPEDQNIFYHHRRQLFATGQAQTCELRLRRANGDVFWAQLCATAAAETTGGPLLGRVTLTDISERKQAERELEQLAHYDALTGLPNRLLFTDRLQQAVAHAARHKRMVGVALLDLDQFKKVNDSLGHATGDALLRQASERLRAVLRPNDTVARLGGDEFTLVFADMAQVDDATLVLQRIRQSFEAPFRVNNHDLFITASIGVALFPSDDRDIEALLRNADVAMYRAKESGRNTWQFYAADMTVKAQENLAIEHALRGAVERGELALHYQPQLSLATGRIIGVEALARWRHPQLGEIDPDRFIPIAEESGLIVPLGEWALRTACAQAVRWHDAGCAPLRMAVNLSSRQLREENFPETVERILHETRCPAAMLEFELTEGMLLKQTESSVSALDKLNKMGVRFAIDDFGTGYSNLAYLRRFPLGALKIDQSFVRDIATDSDAAAIVRAIITMARELGMPVVAEGVETREQMEFLHTHGCDAVQGYYLSHPQPAEAIVELLKDSIVRGKPWRTPEEKR